MCLLLQIKLPATLENLAAFIEPVKSCAEKQGFSQKKILQIELATEEILVNIVNYAYQDHPGYVQIRCSVDDDKRFGIEFEDTGIPFDVLSLDTPDVTAGISERQFGGLGVFFVRKLMDDVRYYRKGDKNILKISMSGSAET